MTEPPEVLRGLQALLDRSAATAGPAIRQHFVAPEWRMSAEEFVAFWEARPMASVSTTSARGAVHVTPLEPRLVEGRLRLPTFANSQRLRDHRANPRCAVSSWDGPYRAIILYGRARELPPDGEALRAGELNGVPADQMVTIEIEPTRIYAIRPPAGHHGAATPVTSP